MPQDPYKALEVDKKADQATIKRAYRRLAKRYHPDVSKTAADRRRFSEISAAYDILGDENKRRQYDISLQSPFSGAAAGGSRGAGVGAGGFDTGANGVFDEWLDVFRRSPSSPLRGQPHRLRQTVRLSFAEAALGCQRKVRLDSQVINLKVPLGSKDQDQLRAGDALIVLQVDPHPFFKISGRDLVVEVPISLRESMLGGKVTVPTLGKPIRVSIKPMNELTGRLRIKGRGLPGRGLAYGQRGLNGDLLIELRVMLPRNLPTAIKAALNALPDDGEQLRLALFDAGDK